MSSNGRSRWLIWGAGSLVALVLVAGVFSSGIPTRVVYACSSVVTYNATVQAPSAGGTISPAPGAYAYTANSIVYFEAIPERYWRFESWSGSVSGTANPIGVTVSNHFTIQPKFTPAVEFETTGSTCVESAGRVAIKVGCGRMDYSTAVSFSYTTSGTARFGSDYGFASGSWTGYIGPYHSYDEIKIDLKNDSIMEEDKTLVFTLVPTQGSTVAPGPRSTYTLTIQDDDMPTASVVRLSDAPEAGASMGLGQFLVSLSEPCPYRDCLVAFDPSGGTAVNGTDFSTDPSPLLFAPGETQKSISYWSCFDDNIDSVPSKTFPLRLVHIETRASAAIGAANNTATGTITDNDETLTIIVRDKYTHATPTYACGNVEPPSGVYPTSFQIDMKAPGNGIGSAFVRFDGDIQSTAYGVRFPLDTSKTIYAYFVETRSFSYSVEPGGFDPFNNPVGCGYVTEQGLPNPSASNLNWGVYEKGSVATMQAEAYAGWRFSHWTNYNSSDPLPFANGTGPASNPASFVMNDHVFVTAHFVPVCGLTLNQTAGGTASVSPPPPVTNGIPYYDVGTQVTLTASAAQGYLFQEWIIQAADGTVTHLLTNPAQLTIAGNVAATPVFIQKFTLTTALLENGTTNATGGTISPTPGPHEYPAQAMVHLKAEPSIGWCFVRWDGITGPNGQTITNPETDLTMNSDKSATAVFATGARLRISILGQGSVSLPNDVVLPTGISVPLTATPAAGWRFTGWAGFVDSPNPAIEVTLTADQIIVARFEYRPEVDSLALALDLGTFLGTVGALPSPSEAAVLAFDAGEVGPDGAILPNGIPDAAELRLLEALLKTGSYDQTVYGGAGSDHIWKCWARNLAQARADLPTALPAVQRVVAAYMTLGSRGHRAFVTKEVREHLGVTLGSSGYSLEAARYLDAQGDVDGDGFWNRLEWKTLMAQSTSPTSTQDIDSYLTSATSIESPLPAEVDFGLDLGRSAGATNSTGGQNGTTDPESGQRYVDPNFVRTVQLLPCGAVSGRGNPVSYEVRVLDPPGMEDEVYTITSQQSSPVALDVPLGGELLVSVAKSPEVEWFDGWSAPGTLMDGSARRVERIRLSDTSAPLQVRPLSCRVTACCPASEIWVSGSMDESFVGPRSNLVRHEGFYAIVPHGCRVRRNVKAASGSDVFWGCPQEEWSLPNVWGWRAIGSTIEVVPDVNDGLFGAVPGRPWEHDTEWTIWTNTVSSSSGGWLCPGYVQWILDPTLHGLVPVAIPTYEYRVQSILPIQIGIPPDPPMTPNDYYRHLVYWGVPERGYELSTISGIEIDQAMQNWVTGSVGGGHVCRATGPISPRGEFDSLWGVDLDQCVIDGGGFTPADAGYVAIDNARAYYTRKTTTPVLFTAVPKAGFAFDHWTLDGPAYQVLADGTLGAVIVPDADPPDEQSGCVTQEKVGIKMADASAQGDRAVVANFATLTMIVAACEGVQVKVQFLYDPASGGLFEAKTETVSDVSEPYKGIPGVRVMACPAEGYALSSWVIKYYNKDTNLLDHQTTATDNSVAVESKGFNIRIEAQGRVLAAKFVEDPSQHYGFDGFSSNQCAYKSVAENCSDTAKVKLYVPPTNVKVAIPETDALKLAVSPVQVSAQEQVETITSRAAVVGASASAEVLVKSGVSPTEATVASLTTKVYKPVQRAILHLVRVSRPGGSPPATIDAAALMSYLNNTIFNQAVVSFSVNTRPDLTVNYDISGRDEDQGNGLDRPQQDGGAETASIIAAQLAEVPGVDNAEYYVFVVAGIRGLDDGALGEVPGFHTRTTADQHPWMFVTGARCPFVIAHELGHCLGLGDLDRPHQPSMDPTNLMAFSSLDDNRKLRAIQWDTVRPSQP